MIHELFAYDVGELLLQTMHTAEEKDRQSELTISHMRNTATEYFSRLQAIHNQLYTKNTEIPLTLLPRFPIFWFYSTASKLIDMVLITTANFPAWRNVTKETTKLRTRYNFQSFHSHFSNDRQSREARVKSEIELAYIWMGQYLTCSTSLAWFWIINLFVL